MYAESLLCCTNLKINTIKIKYDKRDKKNTRTIIFTIIPDTYYHSRYLLISYTTILDIYQV